jgi:hypothetical protein
LLLLFFSFFLHLREELLLLSNFLSYHNEQFLVFLTQRSLYRLIPQRVIDTDLLCNSDAESLSFCSEQELVLHHPGHLLINLIPKKSQEKI